MDVKSVLVEYHSKNEETISNSGTLINNKYIIITSSLCIPILEENCAIKKIHKLASGLQKPNCLIKHNDYIFTVVIGENIRTNNLRNNCDGKETMICKEAKIKALFSCSNIRNSSKKYLSDWTNSDSLPISELLSLFFVLQFVECDSDFTDLKRELCALYKCVTNGEGDYRIGDKIAMECAAFGNRCFVNTYCEGMISNAVGINNCLILTDCAAVPGSEGSPISYKTSNSIFKPLGILVSCLNWWNGEWLGLSLSTSWRSLLPQLISKDHLHGICNFKPTNNLQTSKLLDTANNSIVQIVSGPFWGTGILLQKDKGIFLTNSHVIENDFSIILYWKDVKLRAEIIYKNGKDENYDLAVLKCLPEYLDVLRASKMIEIKAYKEAYKIGDTIYAVGFPLFSNHLKPHPTITCGNISQVHYDMLTTTCSVFPGCSGGAILNQNGFLIAVIVSNIKTIDTKLAFPKLNCSIPIYAFWDTIQMYLKTNDVSVLRKLKIEKKEEIYWNSICAKL